METVFTESQQKRITDAGGIVLEQSHQLVCMYNLTNDEQIALGIFDYNLAPWIEYEMEIDEIALLGRWLSPNTLKEISFYSAFPDADFNKNTKLYEAKLGFRTFDPAWRRYFAILPGGFLVENKIKYTSPIRLDVDDERFLEALRNDSFYGVQDLFKSTQKVKNNIEWKYEDFGWVFKDSPLSDSVGRSISRAIIESKKRTQEYLSKKKQDRESLTSMGEVELEAFKSISETLSALGSWVERIAEQIETNQTQNLLD